MKNIMPVDLPKRNIYEVVAAAKKRESEFNPPLRLGNPEDFSFDKPEWWTESSRTRFLIDDNNVHYIKHPGKIHGTVSGGCIKELIRNDSFELDISTTYQAVNWTGCGAIQDKEADGGIYVRKSSRFFPCVQIEVACGHESEALLLREGALWLSPATDVEYAVLIKIWKEPFRMRIYLLSRTVPPNLILVEAAHRNELSQDLLLKHGVDCPGTVATRATMSLEEKQEKFRDFMKIEQFVEVTAETILEGQSVVLVFDLHRLLGGTGDGTEPDTYEVDLTKTCEDAYYWCIKK